MEMTMMLVSAMVVIAGIQALPTDPTTTAPCLCTRIYKPTCGEDGKTYSNACTMECVGVALKHEGSCDDNSSELKLQKRQAACICTLQYDPMCGDDGVTYGNLCQLKCDEAVNLAYEGECMGETTKATLESN